MKNVLQTLKRRSAWYDKAIKMGKREIPIENGFDWPAVYGGTPPTFPVNITHWEGAKKELDNTIAMMEHVLRMEGTL